MTCRGILVFLCALLLIGRERVRQDKRRDGDDKVTVLVFFVVLGVMAGTPTTFSLCTVRFRRVAAACGIISSPTSV